MFFLNLVRRIGPQIRQLSTKSLQMDAYVWVDLEMTGLDPERDSILEIACVLTTPKLEVLHEGINLVIHQSDAVLEKMNDWSKFQHSKTGLTEASRKSTLNVVAADKKVAEYIVQHTEGRGVKYLAGNSVHMDKMFLVKYMPNILSLLHYRIIDISGIKVLCSHWYPDAFAKIQKKKLDHRALEDVKESIEELKIYKSLIFR